MAGYPYRNLSAMFNQFNQAMQSNSLNQSNQQPTPGSALQFNQPPPHTPGSTFQFNQQPTPSSTFQFNQQPPQGSTLLFNQQTTPGSTLQFNQQPTPGSTLQDIQNARELLNAVIPPATGAFIQNQGVKNSASTNVTKTCSRISLPPSLANRRQMIQTGRGVAEMPSLGNHANVSDQGMNSAVTPSFATANRHLESSRMGVDNLNGQMSSKSTPQLPTFDILALNNVTEPEDSPAPVFSTDMGMGKEFSGSKSEQPVGLLLEPTNTRNKLFPHGAHRILHDNDHWHKFIISGPVSDKKDKILKRILEHTEPSLLLPVMYQAEGDMAVFYARNCGSSIERLCRNNDLVFQIDGVTFVLRILLQCAPVNRLKLNALTIIKKFLENRYNESTRQLDLSNTEHDPELSSVLYCPLSQPSVLHFVLSTAIMYPINFSTLRLCYNGIRKLKIEVLVKASYLRTLDVSHNELLYPNDIKDLQMLNQVTRLILDGNPLCADFKSPEDYISKMKSTMPQLKSLDSVALFGGAIFVPKERNFLCSKDGYQLVDQFLKHYFDRYDWKDRRCLDGLYHNNALFSLTCVQLPGHSTSDGCSLTWYSTYNRNLSKLSDYSKAEKNIYHGPDEILELFSSLPATEHDPVSFCVDLIHYTNNVAAISVSGVFREQPSFPPEPDHMRSFRRIFVLNCTGPNEWQIVNEQLHISNLTTEQVEASFKTKRPPIEAPVAAWLVQDAKLLSDAEKDQMSSIMMQLTTLNNEWATKFLTDSHWYVREALIAFVNKFEAKELPEEAFV